jgi:hypothetical protein
LGGWLREGQTTACDTMIFDPCLTHFSLSQWLHHVVFNLISWLVRNYLSNDNKSWKRPRTSQMTITRDTLKNFVPLILLVFHFLVGNLSCLSLLSYLNFIVLLLAISELRKGLGPSENINLIKKLTPSHERSC